VSRSPEQMKQLQDLAAAAIGFDATRGDVLTLEDLSFEQPVIAVMPPPTMADKVRKGLNDYAVVVRYGSLLVLFLLAYWFMVRPLQKRALSGVARLEAAPTPLLAAHELPQLAPVRPEEDALRTSALKEQLVQLVKAEPGNSTRAVQAWLREDGK
jgi:flagellar M-ring protein FliF